MVAVIGTIGLEILLDMPGIGTVYFPVGGDGLIGGMGSALRILYRTKRLPGVIPLI